MKRIATIVPVPVKPGELTPTTGTKVVFADGTELSGIKRIILEASVGDDLWKARIDCLISIPHAITVELESDETK